MARPCVHQGPEGIHVESLLNSWNESHGRRLPVSRTLGSLEVSTLHSALLSPGIVRIWLPSASASVLEDVCSRLVAALKGSSSG